MYADEDDYDSGEGGYKTIVKGHSKSSLAVLFLFFVHFHTIHRSVQYISKTFSICPDERDKNYPFIYNKGGWKSVGLR